jgi:hypothetical protein
MSLKVSVPVSLVTVAAGVQYGQRPDFGTHGFAVRHGPDHFHG